MSAQILDCETKEVLETLELWGTSDVEQWLEDNGYEEGDIIVRLMTCNDCDWSVADDMSLDAKEEIDRLFMGDVPEEAFYLYLQNIHFNATWDVVRGIEDKYRGFSHTEKEAAVKWFKEYHSEFVDLAEEKGLYFAVFDEEQIVRHYPYSVFESATGGVYSFEDD